MERIKADWTSSDEHMVALQAALDSQGAKEASPEDAAMQAAVLVQGAEADAEPGSQPQPAAQVHHSA